MPDIIFNFYLNIAGCIFIEAQSTQYLVICFFPECFLEYKATLWYYLRFGSIYVSFPWVQCFRHFDNKFYVEYSYFHCCFPAFVPQANNPHADDF